MEIFGVHERTEHPSLAPRALHSHETHEILLVVAGEVDFLVEGSLYPLKAGDLVLMRKGEVHIPRIRSAVPYERMHVNFDLGEMSDSLPSSLLSVLEDRPLGQGNLYPAALFPDNRWQTYLKEICDAADPALRLCYLLPLLGDLGKAKERIRENPVRGDERARQILSYINENLSKPLSLSLLAERFFTSKTHLNRLVKKATGTTVWEYVTLKRLFLARDLLASGIRPTRVCRQAGFGDYTTFFRAYKKRFGIPPKES